MIKRMLCLSLCAALALTMCAHAADAQTDTTSEEITQPYEMPPQGGRGNMNGVMRPGGMNRMPEGNQDIPAPPSDTPAQTPDAQTETPDAGSSADSNSKMQEFPSVMQGGGGGMGSGMRPGGMGGNVGGFHEETKTQPETEQASAETISEPKDFQGFLKMYQTPIFALVLLAFGFLFVIFYRKKNY